MTEKQWEQLSRAIDDMTDAEKLRLIEQVARTIQIGSNKATDLRSETARAALVEAIALPIEGPDDGFSGTDHDQLLYD